MSLRSGDKLVLLTFSQDVDMGICSILKFSAKKGCFLSFEWEKSNFYHFWTPGKIWEKPPSCPPGKSPSDAHGC